MSLQKISRKGNIDFKNITYLYLKSLKSLQKIITIYVFTDINLHNLRLSSASSNDFHFLNSTVKYINALEEKSVQPNYISLLIRYHLVTAQLHVLVANLFQTERDY